MIVLLRIDDRLIHGQVVEGWVNHLKATCILVADDKVAANPLQRTILEIAVPQGLKVLIGSVGEICEKLRARYDAAERAIVLFSNPADALQFLRNAPAPRHQLNLGGMHAVPGKRRLMDVLAVDDADLDALQGIMQLGVEVDVQTVPTEKPHPLAKILKACLGGPGTPSPHTS
ncbi:MAG: PTS sugar transporter subunit IIB [Nitrospiraceae bacterium]|nr:PTS sugar transporter subunit IIB [Nitrospiraceae bacterium]